MSAKNNFHRIISLSAASAALFQSTHSSRGESAEITDASGMMPKEEISSKTSNLILAPPHQEELLRLYADHTSHASHSSHVSGASDYSTPSTPYYPPSPTPATTTIYQPSSASVSSPVSTNAASITNAPTAQEMADKSLIEFLTKEAAGGSANAQYSLGLCYLYGTRGIQKNVEKAKILLELSAVQENAQAKERLEELKQAENKSATPGK
jgi:TPR repeat protein